jgi:hypothetical protein
VATTGEGNFSELARAEVAVEGEDCVGEENKETAARRLRDGGVEGEEDTEAGMTGAASGPAAGINESC